MGILDIAPDWLVPGPSKNPYAGMLSDEAWSYYRRNQLGRNLGRAGDFLTRAAYGDYTGGQRGGGGQNELMQLMKMQGMLEARQDKDAKFRRERAQDTSREALTAGDRYSPASGVLWNQAPGPIREPEKAPTTAQRMELLSRAYPKAYGTAMVKREIPEPAKPPTGMQETPEGKLEFLPGYVEEQGALAEAKRAPEPKIPQYTGEVFLDERVGKFYQTNPKSGKREYITPNEEFMLESTPNGGFRFTKGPKTPAGMTLTTTADIEKRLLAANENYVRLQNMAATFKPEYQETGYRFEDLVTTWKAKLQGAESISPEDTRRHVEYVSHRREAFSNLNQYIKDITGAQMSEFEAKRLRKAVPDPGDTLLGGDDPIAYQAKMASALNEFAKAKARYEYYLQKGLSEGRDYSVGEMEKLTPLPSLRIQVEGKTGNRVIVIEGTVIPI